MRRLTGRFLALPPAEKLLLFSAVARVAYCRLLMAVLPLRWVLRLTVARHASGDARASENASEARKIEWAARVAARILPVRVTCLTRALAQGMMMRARGLAATVVIGVREDGGSGFHAHAWVLPDPRPSDDADRGEWRIVARYPVR